MLNNHKISAIVCAYNEQDTIELMLSQLAQTHIPDQIIVVNDGSSDNTKKILDNLKSKLNLSVIHLKQNMGKGYALATGIQAANNQLLIFLDADIYGLKAEHLSALASPLISNDADMTLGQHTEAVIYYKINPFIIISGQRAVFKKDILPIINDMKQTRYGVETLINLYYLANKKKIKFVYLNGLHHKTKFEKNSYANNAIALFAQEFYQITYTFVKNSDLILQSAIKSNSLLSINSFIEKLKKSFEP